MCAQVSADSKPAFFEGPHPAGPCGVCAEGKSEFSICLAVTQGLHVKVHLCESREQGGIPALIEVDGNFATDLDGSRLSPLTIQ